MDYSLQHFSTILYQQGIDSFNPYSNGLFITTKILCTKSSIVIFVSILILMDYSLQQNIKIKIMMKWTSFNTYSNGLFITTRPPEGKILTRKESFNPYSNGLFITTLYAAGVRTVYRCFNPYSNGLFITTSTIPT